MKYNRKKKKNVIVSLISLFEIVIPTGVPTVLNVTMCRQIQCSKLGAC